MNLQRTEVAKRVKAKEAASKRLKAMEEARIDVRKITEMLLSQARGARATTHTSRLLRGYTPRAAIRHSHRRAHPAHTAPTPHATPTPRPHPAHATPTPCPVQFTHRDPHVHAPPPHAPRPAALIPLSMPTPNYALNALYSYRPKLPTLHYAPSRARAQECPPLTPPPLSSRAECPPLTPPPPPSRAGAEAGARGGNRAEGSGGAEATAG